MNLVNESNDWECHTLKGSSAIQWYTMQVQILGDVPERSPDGSTFANVYYQLDTIQMLVFFALTLKLFKITSVFKNSDCLDAFTDLWIADPVENNFWIILNE